MYRPNTLQNHRFKDGKYTLPESQYVASFDIDAQKTFTPLCPQELPVPHGAEIVDQLNQQAEWASLRLASKDSHSDKALWIANEAHPPLEKMAEPNMDMRWPVHAVPGTMGFELLDGLPLIANYDYVVWKGVELDMHPYGACYHDLGEKLSTGAIEFLQARGIGTVIIGGLATEYCVKTTALQLQRAGFQCVINLAACRGIDAVAIDKALTEMHMAGIAVVQSSHDFMRIL
ncbi:MAG: isochorismatase family protein [Gammaproteobacteria bacterium]|nr:isochorismatase family protein [Gammaproteobacteria bacterium]